MISKKFIYLLVLALSIILLQQNISFAKDGVKNKTNHVNKNLDQMATAMLDINLISTIFYNNGISDISPLGTSGLFYPQGSGKTAVFTSGLLWGGQITGDATPRVGGTAYRTGLQPGAILANGTADDPSLDKYRIYRVRPDVNPKNAADLTAEAKNENTSVDALKAQYLLDWNEWPAALGAPYTDVNGDGIYDPTVDIPGVPGAGQTVWFIANDMDVAQATYPYGALPIGIEVQATYWAYNQTGALGSMYFRKFRLVNKGSQHNTVNNMYVSMFADVDLGDAGDDFVGVDTVLSLQYCYNAQAVDAVYAPLPPPVTGFDFFQGPLVKGVAGQDVNKNGVDDALDYGIFNGKKVGPGLINLPMTAAYYFANGDPNIGDPPQGDIQGSVQFYNFFQGKYGISGAPFINPITGQVTTFALSGDPITGQGWLDGFQLPQGDRRQGSASGPFTLAPGDTQEVVVAEMVAGAIPGVDRISAVGLCKFYDAQAQLAYDNFFNLPSAPPAPVVNAIPLDKEIMLDWGENETNINSTEQNVSKGYSFQGYNVYQLPNASASVSEGVRLATYDIKDGIGKILDLDFDTKSGTVLKVVKQFGNDTGIRRFLDITTDQVRGGVPLVDGIKYYFAVTAYSYNPDPNAVPNNLENPIAIMTIVPQSPNPGVRYGGITGDTIKVTHALGISEGVVSPIIVDPTKLTGHTYKVTFDTLNGNTVWNLTDSTINHKILSNQVNQTGDNNYVNVDGMIVKVSGPVSPGMKDYQIPSGKRDWTWVNSGYTMEGFGGAIGNAFDWWFSGSTIGYGQLKNVLIKFTTADSASIVADPTDVNCSYAYRYLRHAAAPPAHPEFAPFIVNPTGGYAFQDFKKNFPFSAWDVESNPPRRLAVGYHETNDIDGKVDGRYDPPSNNDGLINAAPAGPREFFFIFDKDYSETVDASLAVDALNNTLPMIWFGAVCMRGTNTYATGDQLLILANHLNLRSDVFTFNAPDNTYSSSVAKNDINAINVFPNPYYGINSEELNKYNRFVTFTHLPAKATIRIFTLAGVLVQTITKNDLGQFVRWNLNNQSNLPVSSGLYIAYIDMPDLGSTKIVKVAIIQEQQILDRF